MNLKLFLTATTESLAATVTMSAHDTTPGHIFFNWDLMVSITSNPLNELLFGKAVFSPVKFVVSSKRIDASHPYYIKLLKLVIFLMLRARLVYVFKNWKLLFKNIYGNTCRWKSVLKWVKCCLKTENGCLKTQTKHPLNIPVIYIFHIHYKENVKVTINFTIKKKKKPYNMIVTKYMIDVI